MNNFPNANRGSGKTSNSSSSSSKPISIGNANNNRAFVNGNEQGQPVFNNQRPNQVTANQPQQIQGQMPQQQIFSDDMDMTFGGMISASAPAGYSIFNNHPYNNGAAMPTHQVMPPNVFNFHQRSTNNNNPSINIFSNAQMNKGKKVTNIDPGRLVLQYQNNNANRDPNMMMKRSNSSLVANSDDDGSSSYVQVKNELTEEDLFGSSNDLFHPEMDVHSNEDVFSPPPVIEDPSPFRQNSRQTPIIKSEIRENSDTFDLDESALNDLIHELSASSSQPVQMRMKRGSNSNSITNLNQALSSASLNNSNSNAAASASIRIKNNASNASNAHNLISPRQQIQQALPIHQQRLQNPQNVIQIQQQAASNPSAIHPISMSLPATMAAQWYASALQHRILPVHPDQLDTSGRTPTDNSSISSQLEKRRKRRESHNIVERRRRDNINERIGEIATLLPEDPEAASSGIKLHKGQILQRACEYIKHLHGVTLAQCEEIQKWNPTYQPPPFTFTIANNSNSNTSAAARLSRQHSENMDGNDNNNTSSSPNPNNNNLIFSVNVPGGSSNNANPNPSNGPISFGSASNLTLNLQREKASGSATSTSPFYNTNEENEELKKRLEFEALVHDALHNQRNNQIPDDEERDSFEDLMQS